MVFCNKISNTFTAYDTVVTILILIDGFLQYTFKHTDSVLANVTILILIDGFLQYQSTE